MIKTLFTFLLVLMLVACDTNPKAFNASTYNRSAIGGVRLGQSMAEVQQAMGKPPESQASKALGRGETEVRWYYLTDYASETNTEITFRQGRVVEIRATPWLGDGAFVAPQKK